MIESAAFLLISLVTLGAAVGVVTSRTVFVGALWLVLSFVGVAGLYVLLGAHFLAATQVLVYVGAISVLILFAIMLTQNMMAEESPTNNQWALAFLLAPAIGGSLITLAYSTSWPLTWPARTTTGGQEETAPETYDAVEALGRSLMTEHLLAFEVVSVILLVALVGAIVIARD